MHTSAVLAALVLGVAGHLSSAAMRGKLGIVLVNDPDFETESGEFGGRAMTYYGRWTYKYEEGARHGALGILIIHETKPASYGWATVENSNTNAIFDILRANPRDEHVDVEAWLQRDVAVELFKQAGLDFEALKKQAQSKSFRAVPLKGVTMSANYRIARATVISKECGGPVARDEAVERNSCLQRSLGSPRGRQARRHGRSYLQWRRRQCHGPRCVARARASL